MGSSPPSGVIGARFATDASPTPTGSGSVASLEVRTRERARRSIPQTADARPLGSGVLPPHALRANDLVDDEHRLDGRATVVADRPTRPHGGDRVTDRGDGSPISVYQPQRVGLHDRVVHDQQMDPLSFCHDEPDTGILEIVPGCLATEATRDLLRLAAFRHNMAGYASRGQQRHRQSDGQKPATHVYQYTGDVGGVNSRTLSEDIVMWRHGRSNGRRNPSDRDDRASFGDIGRSKRG